MGPTTRHQCLVYEGSPSLHLRAISRVVCDKLRQNHRCLYMNSRPMVAGMRVSLEAAGVNVAREIDRGSLALHSEQNHLVDGRFDVDRMISTLDTALRGALQDGHAGLWASGDIGWEMGAEWDPAKLLEYEWRLDEFLDTHPEMGGICQYHADTLTHKALKAGLMGHRSIFIDETESRHNPHYMRPHGRIQEAALAAETIALDAAVRQLWHPLGSA